MIPVTDQAKEWTAENVSLEEWQNRQSFSRRMGYSKINAQALRELPDGRIHSGIVLVQCRRRKCFKLPHLRLNNEFHDFRFDGNKIKGNVLLILKYTLFLQIL